MGIREEMVDTFGEDFLFADGFDGAIVGCSIGFDSGRVVYDTRQMVEILLQEPHNLTEEEAWEYLEFNTFGAYVDKKQPIYLETIKP
jgi:hypothetical protein|tara:strand:+ start:521 stop:781 length:261 start_codon:yes stop_codon:yes gene_type:complete